MGGPRQRAFCHARYDNLVDCRPSFYCPKSQNKEKICIKKIPKNNNNNNNNKFNGCPLCLCHVAAWFLLFQYIVCSQALRTDSLLFFLYFLEEEEIFKKMYIFKFVLFTRFSLNWSLLGVKKRLGHAQIGLLLGSDEHPRSFHMGVPPGPNPNSKSGAYHRPLSKSNSIS